MLDAQNIEGDGATLVDRRCESHRLLGASRVSVSAHWSETIE